LNKTWNANLIGALASDESILHAIGRKAVIQDQSSIQLYVRIISKVPYSFPKRQLIVFYGSDLEKWGFESSAKDSNDVNKLVRHFLSENLILFKPQRKVLDSETEVYSGKDFTLIPKTEGYHEGIHYTPLPIFSQSEHGITQSDFEIYLQSQQPVGRIEGISSELKDTPPYILWKNSEVDYRLYGHFTGHVLDEDGFTFTTNHSIHSADFSETWLDDCYEHENTMFVPYEIVTEIENLVSSGKPLIDAYPNDPFMKETVRQTAATKAPDQVPLASTNRHELQEKEVLAEFIRRTQAQGLLYDKKDLYNFHTAMKSSNLVILAGMSGTGKSKLVKAYAETLGLNDDYQLSFIPVRPAWTDDADIIGYVDTRNDVYRPGDSGVINTLLNAKENANKLYIICFDEMNLARVEHYFSQFLSVLEMESGPKKALRLYNDNLEEKLLNSADYPPVIPIGDNVIFVGTVNVDESTYHFSDKVLDRANVITLNVLPFQSLKMLTGELQESSNSNKVVSFDLFESFRTKDREIGLSDMELSCLWDIHTELQKVNKNSGIGPRIVRQIDMYLKNLPESHEYTRKLAFDKQVIQRILTKVRGPEDQLKRFIGLYEKETETIKDSLFLDILDRFQEVSEFSETRNVLIHKAKELNLNGYTL
jgi:hypothetical protein